MGGENVSAVAGECTNVCAVCGGIVIAHVARLKPFIQHKYDCPREDWPVLDAIEYDDGETATKSNWVPR